MSSDAHYPIMFGEHKLYGIIFYIIHIYIYTHNIIPMIVLYVINMYIYAEHACCMSSIYVYIDVYRTCTYPIAFITGMAPYPADGNHGPWPIIAIARFGAFTLW